MPTSPGFEGRTHALCLVLTYDELIQPMHDVPRQRNLLTIPVSAVLCNPRATGHPSTAAMPRRHILELRLPCLCHTMALDVKL